jgi:hypothetical protein
MVTPMPVHDWTRVSAGTFHDFHCTWIPQIKNRLNEGVLPPEYYAQVEQVTGERAYVEPFAVGDSLTAMPLYLTTSTYLSVPLEETYHEAYRGVPRRWRGILGTPRY